MSQNTLQNNSDNSQNKTNFSQVFLDKIAIYEPKFNESLAEYSTWKVGGKAEILVISKSAQTLEELVILAIENNVKYTILGHISNVLISDKGLLGLVIINKSRQISVENSNEKLEENLENKEIKQENEKENERKIIENAQILWDYHRLCEKVEKSDLIWVLGSMDVRAAEYASELFLKGLANRILFCGSFGRSTKGVFEQSEAETFAKIAMENGVPSGAILIENQSTNTGENIQFGHKLLKEKNLLPQSVILVQKPYTERRTWATFDAQYPHKIKFAVSSKSTKMLEYPNEMTTFEELINLMVGNLERIKIYPKSGFQTFQEIPVEVWSAFENLIKLGFDKELTAQSEYKNIPKKPKTENLEKNLEKKENSNKNQKTINLLQEILQTLSE